MTNTIESEKSERITGKILNERWGVMAEHALYSAAGNWYHHLTSFPGALFDKNGYVWFETQEQYKNHPGLRHGQDLGVPDGIASLPEYERAAAIDDEEYDEPTTYGRGSIYPYDMPEEVDIREDSQTVFEWMRKYSSGRLVTDPEFQRNLVWAYKQKSQFIESVLLNIPLPPLFVNENKEGQYIIVDGLQRTSTLHEYIVQKSFSLSRLGVLRDLKGKTFDDLEPRLRAKMEDKKFLVYVIKPTVPIEMVYDIFHRINTGGTQLTRQEIRNCFHIGPATRMLKHLSEQSYFRSAIGEGISAKRMKDREAILRYLAFRILDYRTQYRNDMDAFLGEAMRRLNLMNEEELGLLEADFEHVMTTTESLFGVQNFRLQTTSTRGRINIALMESVCLFFSKRTSDEIAQNKSKIIANYEALLENDEYLDAIQFSTGDTKRVATRFTLAENFLGHA